MPKCHEPQESCIWIWRSTAFYTERCVNYLSQRSQYQVWNGAINRMSTGTHKKRPVTGNWSNDRKSHAYNRSNLFSLNETNSWSNIKQVTHTTDRIKASKWWNINRYWSKNSSVQLNIKCYPGPRGFLLILSFFIWKFATRSTDRSAEPGEKESLWLRPLRISLSCFLLSAPSASCQ